MKAVKDLEHILAGSRNVGFKILKPWLRRSVLNTGEHRESQKFTVIPMPTRPLSIQPVRDRQAYQAPPVPGDVEEFGLDVGGQGMNRYHINPLLVDDDACWVADVPPQILLGVWRYAG